MNQRTKPCPTCGNRGQVEAKEAKWKQECNNCGYPDTTKPHLCRQSKYKALKEAKRKQEPKALQNYQSKCLEILETVYAPNSDDETPDNPILRNYRTLVSHDSELAKLNDEALEKLTLAAQELLKETKPQTQQGGGEQ